MSMLRIHCLQSWVVAKCSVHFSGYSLKPGCNNLQNQVATTCIYGLQLSAIPFCNKYAAGGQTRAVLCFKGYLATWGGVICFGSEKDTPEKRMRPGDPLVWKNKCGHEEMTSIEGMCQTDERAVPRDYEILRIFNIYCLRTMVGGFFRDPPG